MKSWYIFNQISYVYNAYEKMCFNFHVTYKTVLLKQIKPHIFDAVLYLLAGKSLYTFLCTE